MKWRDWALALEAALVDRPRRVEIDDRDVSI
jgi:hypothetical protein